MLLTLKVPPSQGQHEEVYTGGGLQQTLRQEKKTRTELEQSKLQLNLFSYCTLKPNSMNKLQAVLLKDLQHILCLEK